jgi:hypothetical protein
MASSCPKFDANNLALAWCLLSFDIMSIQNNIENPGIESKIYLIRSETVMLDSDLATLYLVPTKRLKEQVRRNIKRFPSDFMFQLTEIEWDFLRSQNATSKSGRGGNRVLPFAFTEHGITMLSSVLNSDRAVEVNLAIVRSFIRLRKVLHSDRELAKRLSDLELKCDGKFKSMFEAIRLLMDERNVPRKRIVGLGN